MPKYGHLPGHYRRCFDGAVPVLCDWFFSDQTAPPPMVVFEVDYEPREITLARACANVRRCSDVLPGGVFHRANKVAKALGLPLRQRSYAAAAAVITAALMRSDRQRPAEAERRVSTDKPYTGRRQ